MEKKKDLSWLFVLLLFLGVLMLLFSGDDEGTPGSLGGGPAGFGGHSPEQLQRVNKHLKETAINLEKERLQRMQETNQEIRKYSSSAQQEVFQSDPQFSFDADPNMQALTQELDRSQALDESHMTPEQIVQKKLYENQWMEKADQEYREQYAAQFVENARRAGWAIELGPNFEILSVRKIPNHKRQPSQLFDTGGAGSR